MWSLSKGKLLRNIIFPSIIDAIALDPAEHVFYAGGRDGKIYTAALNAKCPASSDYGLHILGSLSNQRSVFISLQLSLIYLTVKYQRLSFPLNLFALSGF